MKKILSLFAIFIMMAISASAGEVTINLTEQEGHISMGDSKTIDGVTITVNRGDIMLGAYGSWHGDDGGNSFTISMENGATIVGIDISGNIQDAQGGEGWQKLESSYIWTGSATSVNTGATFMEVTYLRVMYNDPHTHSWATAWTTDDNAHWHRCTASGCTISDYFSCGESGAAYGGHQYSYDKLQTAYYTCSTCGYVSSSRKAQYDAYPITISETDDESVPASYKDKYTEQYCITVNRTMKAGQWNTLCLPFYMYASEAKAVFGDDAEIMIMTGIENNVVNFETYTNGVDLKEMYIVKPTKDITSFTINDRSMDLFNGTSISEDYTGWTVTSPMYATQINKESSNTKYILGSDDKFYEVADYATVKGFRWYIQSATGGSAKALKLSFNGEETGINLIDSEQIIVGNGKYIENGRIVIVKNNKKYNVNGMEVK